MNSRLATLLFIGMTVMIAPISAQRAGPTGSIEGIVVAAESGAPLANVLVAPKSGAGVVGMVSTRTNPEGRFFLPEIPVGEYRLTATRDGYVKSEYGQRYPEGPSLTLSLTAGRRADGIQLAMTRGGVISGHVTQLGRPAAQARVFALRTIRMDGAPRIVPISAGMTNDRGEYRLFWLPPGHYFVVAGPEGNYPRSLNYYVLTPATRQSTDNLVPVFFPGTVDFQAAATVEVSPGGESANVNIEVSAVPLRTIRGTISGGEPGRETSVAFDVVVPPLLASQAFKELLPENLRAAEGGVFNSTGTVASSRGTFEIRNLIPGIYAVRAADSGGAREVLADVRDRDAAGVLLTIGEGVRLTGRVVIERRTKLPDGTPDPLLQVGMSVTLTSDRQTRIAELGITGGQAGSGAPGAAAPGEKSAGVDAATGVFTIPASNSAADVRRTGPAPGAYRVWVEPLLRRPTPPGQQPPALRNGLDRAYVKSIRFGNEDILHGSLRIEGPTDRQLTVVIGTDPGAIRGRVEDSAGRPMSRMRVVAIPENSLRFRVDHRFTSSDAAGQFRFENMAPGNYKIFAWEQSFPGAWQDPAFVEPYASQATPVHVDEGATVTIDVQAIPARRNEGR